MNPTQFNCILAGQCSGCDRAYLSYSDLRAEYINELAELGFDPKIVEFVEIDPAFGFRDRTDLVVENQNGRFSVGFYSRQSKTNPINGWRHLLTVSECQQFSPALKAAYRILLEDPPPVEKRGSIRLRVSPHGQAGLWIDYSNNDIKNLLLEKNWIARFQKKNWIIEAGQKRKRISQTLDEQGTQYKLIDPEHFEWFSTFNNEGTAIPLYGAIAGFSQPSIFVNRLLVKAVVERATALNPRTILEFGCGNGNFTLPLFDQLSKKSDFKYFALEIDRSALQGLRQSLGPYQSKIHQIELLQGDFVQKPVDAQLLGKADLILVDPPRSGLGRFVDSILPNLQNSPPWIYVSCYPATLAKDVQQLSQNGYRVKALKIIEQFPGTKHFEVICLLETGPF